MTEDTKVKKVELISPSKHSFLNEIWVNGDFEKKGKRCLIYSHATFNTNCRDCYKYNIITQDVKILKNGKDLSWQGMSVTSSQT